MLRPTRVDVRFSSTDRMWAVSWIAELRPAGLELAMYRWAEAAKYEANPQLVEKT
jgi:hypothetical protein